LSIEIEDFNGDEKLVVVLILHLYPQDHRKGATQKTPGE
jgi:hypothetical protein